LLGLDSTASQNEIIKAYRRLVLIHHPDKGGNQETVRELKILIGDYSL
jgi:curved DNA-binding protein CbpA